MTAAARAPALFLIDKPTGLTSHDVVQQVRRWTGVRRVGHGGTLDPMATGLLPVFVGSATRLVEYIASHPKSYSATILLGVSTDTDDADGSILAEAPVPDLGRAGLDRLLDRFRGAVEQVPPIYSAIKVGGVSAHRAARRGEPLVLASRPVTFHALTIDGWEPPLLRIEMTVSSGTYVRALARDLGAALGCGGHVTQMRRTRIGPVGVAEA
ncbi:MAG: tRNA pseudouridine(55) synthase TruB, partial [Dehalococcoidia bacterium]